VGLTLFSEGWGQNLEKAVIGDATPSIGANVFNNCSGLTSVTIGNSVTSIGNYAFGTCSGLTSITIPDSVTTINTGAFYGCSGLANATIGSGVTVIYDNAFSNCSNLGNITSLATTGPSLYGFSVFGVKANGTLYVPAGSTNYDGWMSSLGSGWTKVEQ
jgi:hypothetical protein